MPNGQYVKNIQLVNHKVSHSVAASLFNGILSAAENLSLPIKQHLIHKKMTKMSTVTKRIDFELFRKLILVLEQVNHNADMGIKLGSQLGISSFSALGYAAASCNTLWDALLLIPKYESIVMTLGKTEIVMDEQKVEVYWSMKEGQYLSLLEDLFLSSWLTLAQLVSGQRLVDGIGAHPAKISFYFTHSEPEQLSDWQLFFGKTLFFNQEKAGLKFDKTLLNLELIKPDSYINEVMTKEAEELNSAISTSLSEQVISWLLIQLPLGEPEQKRLAQNLSMSERTLRRRLQDEGINFKSLLEKVRKDKANYFLTETSLSLWEIATQLGYKQLTTFNAAYKRWTGKTPASQR